MPNQVSNPTILPALLIGAASSVLLCLAISHGLLRTFMHARGVAPWTLADTIGSTLLITVSAALVGGAAVLFALMTAAVIPFETLSVSSATVLLLLGALLVRLGLLALRKLT